MIADELAYLGDLLDNMPLAMSFLVSHSLAGLALKKPTWSWRDVQAAVTRKPGPAPVLPVGEVGETKRPDLVRAMAAKRSKIPTVIVLPAENEALDQLRWEDMRWGYKDEPGTF